MRMWFPQLTSSMESFLVERLLRNLEHSLENFILELGSFHGLEYEISYSHGLTKTVDVYNCQFSE